MASVDNIYERLKPNMMIRSYYKGLTSDEKYNDDTGLAYLINFDSDGYVQFLYCGPFSKGLLNTTKEHTGWEVLYSIDTEDYYTKEGEFINNHAVDPSANDISIEEIQTYLKDNEIDPEINLEWK